MASLARPRGAPRKGARGGKYTIDRVIGRGSFGTAWLVRSNADSRMYVMKRLALDHMNEKEKDEAHNECVVLMKLRRHPNIIRVREHFVEDGRLCIVMDFADGGDLAQRIEAQAAGRTPFPEAQVLDWFVQLCLALKHAHDRKVLHRDLKPQNVFLTRKNFVRLGDFGISKVLAGTMAVASTCVGTPLYLAPELCEGKLYNHSCDVWSLGVILYEMLALAPPFIAQAMPALVMKICGAEPPPLPAACSPPVRELAARLLQKDPTARPRVPQIVEEPFVKERIEKFLEARLLQEEFSHHYPRRGSRGGGAGAGTGGGGAGSGGEGGGLWRRARRARCSARAAAGATRKPAAPRRSPTPPAEAAPADAAAKAEQSEARRKAEAKRREEMRDAIRRDRQAARASPPVGGGDVAVAVPAAAADGPRRESTAFELVLKSTEAAQPLHPAYARAPPTPATPAPPTPAPPTPSPATPEADPRWRVRSRLDGGARAVRVAAAGGHLLAESAACRGARGGGGVDAQGQAGRALLNDSQREMNTITRMLSNMSKRYVVVRAPPTTTAPPDGAGDQAAARRRRRRRRRRSL